MTRLASFGFWRVAAAVPPVVVGDVAANRAAIARSYRQAVRQGAAVVVTPELSLTGYTLGDLVQQEVLLGAARRALVTLAGETKSARAALVVGLPWRIEGRLYNMAAVLAEGRIAGLVPKSYLPNYGEFYEQRWYAPAAELAAHEVTVDGQRVPVGIDLLFELAPESEAVMGVEVCEDLWAPIPPSCQLALGGATIIANLSASNELVGKMEYRRQLVAGQSARLRCGYVYVGAGAGESSTDVVFGGHALVAENGAVLAESERFESEPGLLVVDLDLQHMTGDRAASNTFKSGSRAEFRRVTLALTPAVAGEVHRRIDPWPFVPQEAEGRDRRTAEVFAIQSAGLATRLRSSGLKQLVLGLSGGLDSTLALLVALAAGRRVGLSPSAITAITMPGAATSDRTKSNAYALAEALGVAIEEVPIGVHASELLAAVKHDSAARDVTYENAQARYRTLVLMTRANQLSGLVVGTGDLSELALGWVTFSGDHISHYNVNAGVPKTLVRHVVDWAGRTPQFAPVAATLADILATPVSPELVDAQETEALIGPYELHDFFLYHLVRWRTDPAKLEYLAAQAFGERYTSAERQRWLKLFITRFFGAQWKRSVMPDGPKVGSVALSPRGDWRMPSDASAVLWLAALEQEDQL